MDNNVNTSGVTAHDTGTDKADVDSGARVFGLTGRERGVVLGYILLLTLCYNVAVTGVSTLALQFVLKDTLKLSPQGLSWFGLFADIPYFIAFAFGFLRDRWKPLWKGDRGYFLLLPPLLACAKLTLAFGPFTYGKVLAATILAAVFMVWLGAAMNGLMAIVAQYHGMAGRFAVLLLLAPRLVQIGSNTIGGRLADPAHQHLAFLISGLLCLPLMGMALWKPGVVFAHERAHVNVVPEGAVDALKRLVRHRAIYLPAIIVFLWAFAPGWGTPLFFYMTNTVKVSEKVYGDCGAIQNTGMLLAILAYSGLCYRLRLRPLLWLGTFLGVLGCPIFLLVHSAFQAYIIYFLAGVSLGIAVCAYNDLLFRCCPKQLEGVAVMLSTAMSYVAGDTSDLFGSWLYEKGGFGLALAVSTLFTGLIFVVLPFIPKRLTDPVEGQPLREAIELEVGTVVGEVPATAW